MNLIFTHLNFQIDIVEIIAILSAIPEEGTMIESEVEMSTDAMTAIASATMIAVGEEITALTEAVVRNNLQSEENMDLVELQMYRLHLLLLLLLLPQLSRQVKFPTLMLPSLQPWRLRRSCPCPVCLFTLNGDPVVKASTKSRMSRFSSSLLTKKVYFPMQNDIDYKAIFNGPFRLEVETDTHTTLTVGGKDVAFCLFSPSR